MSVPSTVTVPGTNNNSSILTVSQTPGDVALIAQQISLLLYTASQDGHLGIATDITVPVPNAQAPTLELNPSSTVINAFVPIGYEYVVTAGSVPVTLAGSNPSSDQQLFVLSGDAGGVYFLTGGSDVQSDAVFSGTAGNNTVVASGAYEIYLGNATSSATGNAIYLTQTGSSGSVAAGDFASISAAAGTTSNVTLQGSYDLIGVDGVASIDADGNHAGIVGDTVGGAGVIDATVSGAYATIGAGNDTQAVTISGIDAVDFGGTNTNKLVITNAATGATLAGGSGAETIAAAVNTTLYAGTGSINFNASAGIATVTGTTGSDVSFNGGSTGSFVYYAGHGNETLDATGTSSANTVIFYNGLTSGTDYLTHIGGTSDTLYLSGYDSNSSAASLLANATNSGSGITLHLSDNTRITFTDISTTSDLTLNIVYHPSA